MAFGVPATERTFAEKISPDALPRLRPRAPHWHVIREIGGAIASGSFPTGGMIVAPCSMRTLAAVAYCQADTLLIRAARRAIDLLPLVEPLASPWNGGGKAVDQRCGGRMRPRKDEGPRSL